MTDAVPIRVPLVGSTAGPDCAGTPVMLFESATGLHDFGVALDAANGVSSQNPALRLHSFFPCYIQARLGRPCQPSVFNTDTPCRVVERIIHHICEQLGRPQAGVDVKASNCFKLQTSSSLTPLHVVAAGGLPAVRLQAWRPGGRKALPARPGIANRGAALAGCLA